MAATNLIDTLHNTCSVMTLADKKEKYQNCSALYCLSQMYAVISSHIWAVLTGLLLLV